MFKIKSDFLKDSVWALVGNVFFRGSSLVSTFFLAHILQKIAYGEFNSLKNTLTTLAVFTTFGLGYTSTKFVAENISKKAQDLQYLVRKIYKITILFSGVVAILLFLFANNISLYYYNNVDFVIEIKILSFWVICMAVSTTQNGIISGLKIFKELAGINCIIGILTLIVTPLLAYFYGVKGACISLIVIQLINNVLYFFIISKSLKKYENKEPCGINTSKILFYSLPITFIEAIFSLGLWINYYLMQNNFNYGELALFSTAMQWYILLLFIPMILRNVILSYFSSEQEQKDGNIFQKALLFSFCSAIIPAFILFMCSGIIAKLYGVDFSELKVLFRITALISIFASCIGVIEQYLFSISKNWIVFFISMIKDIGISGLFLYFICVKNITDAAYYLMLSYLILYAAAFTIYFLLYFCTDLFPRRKFSFKA